MLAFFLNLYRRGMNVFPVPNSLVSSLPCPLVFLLSPSGTAVLGWVGSRQTILSKQINRHLSSCTGIYHEQTHCTVRKITRWDWHHLSYYKKIQSSPSTWATSTRQLNRILKNCHFLFQSLNTFSNTNVKHSTLKSSVKNVFYTNGSRSVSWHRCRTINLQRRW